MKVLDLFSGIGGFSLGLERAGMETAAFCEIEDYPVSILKKHWPDVPIHRDIRKLDGKQYRNSVDVVCGGFPCQPFSVAGKQRGKEDNRHLWPEMLRIIKESKPTWVIGENVAGFIRMALDDVLLDLEAEGYTTQSLVIPACAVGGIHRRDRVWIIGYSEHAGRNETENRQSDPEGNDVDETGPEKIIESAGSSCKGGNDANANGSRFQQSNEAMEGGLSKQLDCFRVQPEQTDSNTGNSGLQGSTEKPLPGFEHIQGELVRRGETIGIVFDPLKPAICGTHDGFPGRVAQLKALGNAVVPQIPELIGRAIINMENKK